MRQMMIGVVLLLTIVTMAFADMEADRKQLIEQLIQQGIFTKANVPGKLPRVYVGAAFHTLTFDKKQLFVGVVYAYFYRCQTKSCIDSPDGMVVVYDGRTNKKIGRFSISPNYGSPGLRLN